MEQEITGGYKAVEPVPTCIKCGRPKEDVIEAFNSVEVIKCLNCDASIASGNIVGLRAVCWKCGALINVV